MGRYGWRRPTNLSPIEQDIEEVRGELEELDEQFHGEYDGWGGNLKAVMFEQNTRGLAITLV